MSTRRYRLLIVRLLFCFSGVALLLNPFPAQAQTRTANPLQAAALATVQILIGDLAANEISSGGSGVLIDERGFVLRNED